MVESPTMGGSATAHQNATAGGPRGAIVQTHGTITIEGNPPVIAGGAPVYHAGQYMCWCDADAVSLGTFYLVQSVGTDWAGGGGQGSFGINAVLAPVNRKQTLHPGDNTVTNPFPPAGAPSYPATPTFLLALEIGASAAPTDSVGPSLLPARQSLDGAATGKRCVLVRTSLVECGGGACQVYPVGGNGHTTGCGVGLSASKATTVVASANGNLIITVPSWPGNHSAGGRVVAAMTMTALAQGAAAHDQHGRD